MKNMSHFGNFELKDDRNIIRQMCYNMISSHYFLILNTPSFLPSDSARFVADLCRSSFRYCAFLRRAVKCRIQSMKRVKLRSNLMKIEECRQAILHYQVFIFSFISISYFLLYTRPYYALLFHEHYSLLRPIFVAVRSKAWVCGRSMSRIVGLNPARSMNVCIL